MHGSVIIELVDSADSAIIYGSTKRGMARRVGGRGGGCAALGASLGEAVSQNRKKT